MSLIDVETRNTDIRNTLLHQLGRMNLIAISGGRVKPFAPAGHLVGVELPVANGWKVRVVLNTATDTYTVQRLFRSTVKAEIDDVYADQMSETAYRASCYLDKWAGHEGAE